MSQINFACLRWLRRTFSHQRQELLIFDGCAHAPIYENVEEFNEKTLQFLKRHERAVTTGAA
jgi:hypothetical protein